MSGNDRNSVLEHMACLEEFEELPAGEKKPALGLLDNKFWQQLIDNYAAVTDMSIVVVASSYSIVASSVNIPEAFIDTVFQGHKPTAVDLLARPDAEAYLQALKSETRVVYQGAFGLFRAWLPIKMNDVMVGAMWLGCSTGEHGDDDRIEPDCAANGLNPDQVKDALSNAGFMSMNEFMAQLSFIEFSLASVAQGQFYQMKNIKAEKQNVFINMIQNSFEVDKNLETVLSNVLDSILALLQAHIGIIMLSTEDGEFYTETASRGFAGDHPIVIDRRGDVSDSLQACLSDDVVARGYGFEVIELKANGARLGILVLYIPRAVLDKPESRRVLNLVKEHVSAGIVRTRAYDKIKRRDLLAKASLMQLGRAMGSTLDPKRLTRQITQAAMAVMEAELCDLLLIKNNNLEFQVASGLNKILKGYGNVPLKFDPASNIIKKGRPFVIRNIRSNSRFYERPWLNREKFKSYVGVPIKQDDKVIGVLEVFSRAPSRFEHDDVRLLQSLAGPVAASLRNLELFNETTKKAEELKTLHAHTLRIVAEKDISKTMKEIVAAAKSAAGSLMAAAALYNPDTSHFEHRTTSIDPSLGERALTETQGKTASYTEKAYARILRTGKPVRLDDITLLREVGERPADRPPRGFLGVPLVGQDMKPCGVVMVSFKKDGTLFTGADEEVITTLANQASIAIQNVTLYRDLSSNARALEIANKIGQLIISTLELKEVIEQILNYTSALLGVERVCVALIDENKSSRCLVYEAGLDAHNIQAQFVRTLTTRAIEQGDISVVGSDELESTAKEHSLKFGDEEIRQILSVPLVIFGKELGAIHAFETVERTFTAEELTIMRFFSVQAGIAIDNARLYRQLEYRAKGLKSLFSISQKLNASHDSKYIEKSIIDAVADFAESKSVFIALYDESEDLFEVSQSIFGGVEHYPNERLVLAERRRAMIFEERELFYISDTAEDRGLVLGDGLIEEYFPSFLGIPLVVKDKVLGILGMSADKADNEQQFEEDLELLQIFATQAAIAIDNSLLYEETQARAENLSTALEVSEIVTSEIDLNSIFERIAQALDKMFSVDNGCIFLSNRGAEELEPAYIWGLPNTAFKETHLCLTSDYAIVRALREKRQITIDDSGSDSSGENKCIDFGGDFRSAVIIPLIVKGKSLGVMKLFSTEKDYFTRERIMSITLFTNQCAIAIRNNQLYGRVVEEEIARREAEISIELLEEKAKSSVVIEGTTEGIFMVDADFNIELFNPALERMTGKKAPRVIGKKCFDVFKDIFVEGTVCEHCPMITGEASKQLSIKSNIRLKSGELRYVQISHSLIEHEGKRAAIGSVRDITKDHELEVYRHDLRVATEVQNNLLPRTKPYVKGLDIGFICKPAKQIGGDYFDFIPLGNDKLGIAIGDVAGKSLPAALLVSMHKYILRSAAANTDSVISPLRAVNRILWEDTSPEVFVTTIYGVYNSKTSTFAYANAGHLPPLLASKGVVEYLWDPQTPLGIRESLFVDQKQVVLGAGDVLVLLSDGVTDIRDKRGGCFGLDRLKRLVKKNVTLGAQRLTDLIYRRTIAFSAGELNDDFTIVVLKSTEEAKAPALSEFVVANKPVAVNDVRRFVAEELKKAGMPRIDTSDVLVAVCEAVTNSVMHGQSPDGENNNIRVTCALGDDCFKIRIADNGIGYNPNLAEWRPPDLIRDRGRGIFLMQELVDDIDFIATDRGTAVQLSKKIELNGE
ncbi:MAG: GAF domain-containing protein [Actinobacteria bacterium]|nr:GAF domain-containing protein [Actinomycetota bacterium]